MGQINQQYNEMENSSLHPIKIPGSLLSGDGCVLNRGTMPHLFSLEGVIEKLEPLQMVSTES
jgi:hypothetical protein